MHCIAARPAVMMPGMAEDRYAAAMHEHYLRGEEADRLVTSGHGQLEFERTQEIVLRHLPPAPATVADVGGGPGRYTLWLARLGYRVVHRDVVPLHVGQLRAAAAALPTLEWAADTAAGAALDTIAEAAIDTAAGAVIDTAAGAVIDTAAGAVIDTAVGDARSLDLADASVDAVLLLGPLYHLTRRAERVQALREARRVVRSGGPVFAAAISRWAARYDGVLRLRQYEQVPGILEAIGPLERTGVLPPLEPGWFTAYTHRPGQLRAEFASAGLAVADLVNVECGAFLLADLRERMADPVARQVIMDSARAVERVPELMGLGSHLLATGLRS
jgi:SAM-dependent methyltransferase